MVQYGWILKQGLSLNCSYKITIIFCWLKTEWSPPSWKLYYIQWNAVQRALEELTLIAVLFTVHTMLNFCTNTCIESVPCFVSILFWPRELDVCEIWCISLSSGPKSSSTQWWVFRSCILRAGGLIGSLTVLIQKADSGCCHCHLSLLRKTLASYSYCYCLTLILWEIRCNF